MQAAHLSPLGTFSDVFNFTALVEDMEIWSASDDGFSFVISHGSPTGPGFYGRFGYWRRGGHSLDAVVTEAEEACNAMLRHLKQKDSDPET